MNELRRRIYGEILNMYKFWLKRSAAMVN